jgi:hypothetical protein
MLIEYAVGDLLSGGSGNHLEAGPHSEVHGVSQVVWYAILLCGDDSDLLEKFSVLAHIQGLPELIWETLGAREFLKVRVIAHCLHVMLVLLF